MNRLELSFFGIPQIVLNGQAISLDRRKSVALLAYLALERQPQSRDQLASLFWPEADQQKARTTLRRVLSTLTTTLGETWFASDRDTIRLLESAQLSVDVLRFYELIRQPMLVNPQKSKHEKESEAVILTQAVALYRDPFLNGFIIEECVEFELWQTQQRAELERLFVNALEQLAQNHQNVGDFEQAAYFSRRWLTIDPLNEAANRSLMTIYALAGQRSAALRQFEECETLLARELNLSPDEKTWQVFEAIQSGTLAPSTTITLSAHNQPQAEDEQPFSHELLPAVLKTNLPRPLTSFIGRDQEIKLIKEMLLDHADCQLLTLVGAGGAGKTRLALQAANECIGSFPDGVFFVSLASIEGQEHLIAAIADVFGYIFHQQAAPKVQLLEFLRNKATLLLLDNFEQLIRHASLLTEMLTAAAEVKLLVTSRERLHLQPEWILDIDGLAYPQRNRLAEDQQRLRQSELGISSIAQENSTPENPADLLQYSAVQLFIDRVRRVVMRFSPEKEVDAILRICQLTEGLPLALEMAAAWARVLTCRQIAQEIERGLTALESTLADLPKRQQSLRAIFEQTWRLLTPEERTIYAQLAIFRGGFEREAAENIVGASLSHLASLADKALLRRDEEGYFTLHEQLRQFALLLLSDEQMQRLRQQHSHYFAQVLQQTVPQLFNAEQDQAFNQLHRSIANLQTAWQSAIEQRSLSSLDAALAGYFVFYDRRGWLQEGRDTFRLAATCAEELGNERLTARLKIRQAHFCFRLGEFDEVAALIDTAMEILHDDGNHQANQREVALGFHILGCAARSRSDFSLAREYSQKSVQLFAETGDQVGEADALNNLGVVALWIGDYAAAEQYLNRSRDLYIGQGDRWNLATSLHNLGLLAAMMGSYEQAELLYQQALRIWHKTGNLERVAKVLGNQSSIAHARKEYKKAIDYQVERLTLEQEIGNPSGAAMTLYNLAVAYAGDKQFDESIKCQEASLRILQELGMRRELARGLHALGDVEFERGNYQEAIVKMYKALGIAKEIGDLSLAPTYVAGIGEVLTAKGEVIRGVTLLVVALNAPSVRHDTKQAIHAILERTALQATTEQMTAGHKNGASLRLDQVIDQLLLE